LHYDVIRPHGAYGVSLLIQWLIVPAVMAVVYRKMGPVLLGVDAENGTGA
jgi:hypothetical protein